MKILPGSQITNLPILEDVLEEVRLNILDHIQVIGESLDLYSLSNQDLKNKLTLLGLENITIGKFISLNLSSDEFEFISPEFYKMYRKVNQHRGNKMSMDYIFHSAGMMNTLVHSNSQFYNQNDIFGDNSSFFEFNTYRDNEAPELEIGDGYIIVPYSSNRLQTLKEYLATNPIIFNFLPAGYTFIFLSDYQNSYGTGVLQYDNLLDYDCDNSIWCEEYWDEETIYQVPEVLLTPHGEEYTYNWEVPYYDPFLYKDTGKLHFVVDYPRYTSDSLYSIPVIDSLYYKNLDTYLAFYNGLLLQQVLEEYDSGEEANLNNSLKDYKDIWLGDYLLPSLNPELLVDSSLHVWGLKSIQYPSYSYASLYNRGQSLASQYFLREEALSSCALSYPQVHKRDLISDRREMDLFKFNFLDDYAVWLINTEDAASTDEELMDILQITFAVAEYLTSSVPSLLKDCMDLEDATQLCSQLATADPDGIYVVKDANGNIV